ncbi:MAG: hypothetical protein HDR43_03265 [Mycoplasma sp.]|nr:hypothetical protein [Mycoplasma sp.]
MKKNKNIIAITGASIGAIVGLSAIPVINKINNNLNYSMKNNLENNIIYDAEKDELGYIYVVVDNIKYEINLSDQFILVKDVKNLTSDATNITELVIKDSISFRYEEKEYAFNVTKIADKAFTSETLNNVTLYFGNNIEYIGEKAFSKSEFKQIVFSNKNDNYDYISNIKNIGDEAFYQCEGLSNILILSSKITTIGKKAFSKLNNNIYYSNKIIVDSTSFETTNAIKVEETKFNTDNLTEINNKVYNQFKVPNLINNGVANDESSIKNYIINNINNIFTNSPVDIENKNDLKPENIQLSFEKSDDDKKVYINDIKLNYYYDENGDIQKGNDFKNFGNILLEHQEQEISKQETKIISPISASSLNLNNELASNAKDSLTNEFVFNNLDKFFSGDKNILSKEDISIKNKYVSNNSIIMSLELLKGSWYDQGGNLGSYNKTFVTLITGFKSDEVTITKKETKVINPIDAELLKLHNITNKLAEPLIDSQFIFNNINIFLTGDYNVKSNYQITNISKSLTGNSIDVTFELAGETCYDSTGQLITSTKQFSTRIINFKTENQKYETKIINPILASNLSLSDKKVDEAVTLINNELIYNNLTKFFTGNTNINNKNNINVSIDSKSSISIQITIKLTSGSWYDQDGNLGNSEKSFKTMIIGFKQNETITKTETKVYNPIDSKIINLGEFTAEQSLNTIDNKFIFNHINAFLYGSHSINSYSDIISIQKTLLNNENSIEINFSLASNTWYNQNGALGNNQKEFKTKIINFKNINKNETKIINPINAANLELSNLSANDAKDKITNQFVFENLNKFFEGSHNINSYENIKIISNEVSNNQLNLSIELDKLTWYGQNGNLESSSKVFNTIINNFHVDNNKPDEITHLPTKVKNPIDAVNLNLNNVLANQAIEQINSDFIFKNIIHFLEGDYLINSSSDITISKKEVVDNSISIELTLSNQTWYDSNGQLGSGTKTFETKIINFKDENKKNETKIIDIIQAININLADLTSDEAKSKIDNNFIYTNLDKFFTGDNNIQKNNDIEINSIQENNNSLIVEIKLISGSWYNQNGELGNIEKTFVTTITNFKNPSTENPDNGENNKNKPTQVNNPIEAHKLNLSDYLANDALGYISNEFIYNYINIFLTGSHKINNSSFIISVTKEVSENKIKVTFELSTGCWYDENGNLGTENKKFETEIINFKSPEVKRETTIIDPISANDINLNNKSAEEAINDITANFIFTNLNKFFSGDYNINVKENIENVNVEISNNSLIVKLDLVSHSWYDEYGNLGDNKKSFTTVIKNFIIKPDEIKKLETKAKNIVYAKDLKLDNFTAQQSLSTITNDFIFKNISYFLEGNYELTNNSQISITTIKEISNTIELEFSLRESTWYDKDGKLGTTSKVFKVTIINFKDIDKKEITRIINPIYASSLNLNNKTAEEAKNIIDNNYVFNHLKQFFGGDINVSSAANINIKSSNVSNNSLSISIELVSNTWYDYDGKLGTTNKVFTTSIINFKISNGGTTNPGETIKKSPTVVINPIEAYTLGLSNTESSNAESIISSEFIFSKINSFLKGSYEIKDSSSITNLNKKINGNNIELSFELVAQSWYDENGNLGNTNKKFDTKIINFKQPEIKKETKIINIIIASNISLSNKTTEEAKSLITDQFVLDNLNKFFSGDYNIYNKNQITIESIDVNSNTLNVKIKLSSNTWYDANGNLGTSEKTFSTTITNFKNNDIVDEIKKNQTVTINPINSSSLGWANNTAVQVINNINSNFIYQNVHIIIKGDHDIKSTNNITNVKANISSDGMKIDVSFDLGSNSWYDENGKQGNSKKTFYTTIVFSKQPTVDNNKPSIPGTGDDNTDNPDISDEFESSISNSKINPWNKWYSVAAIGTAVSLVTLSAFAFFRKLFKWFRK